MSIAPGRQSTLQPYSVPQAPISSSPVKHQQAQGIGFDRFQRLQTTPVIMLSSWDKARLATLHPRAYLAFKRMSETHGPAEGIYEGLYMYDKLQSALGLSAKKSLNKLLSNGILHDTRTDDKHSALYHLYAMLTTRRAPGYNNKVLLKETVELLARPYTITQKFAPLSKNMAQAALQVRNEQGSNQADAAAGTPITPDDLNVDSSATCVSSSVMYYMADKEPAELARHLNELTSPLNAFFEKTRMEEISPDNPAQAIEILNTNKIPYSITGPGEVTVKVENPPTGVIRALDSQRFPTGHQYRNAIEAAYQSALTYLATRSYDPATDMRDSDTPGESSKGLTEAEKTLMESIIKENGGVQSVTYQAVANKANPQPGEEGNSYLYGYNRSFEQTTSDIIQSLKMKEPVIIGTTDTDESGAIVTGHEITITGAYVDPSDQQLKFIVADSDDDTPKAVIKTARELIPTIHHAGLPLRLARKINQEISNHGGYLIPDQQDATNFKLLKRETNPMPVESEPVAENTITQPVQYPTNYGPAATIPNLNPGFTRPSQPGTQISPMNTLPQVPAIGMRTNPFMTQSIYNPVGQNQILPMQQSRPMIAVAS